jgi:hypothetical protein
MRNPDRRKFRVVTILTEQEKELIQELAWDSGRSMSSYIRHIIIQELRKYEYDEY